MHTFFIDGAELRKSIQMFYKIVESSSDKESDDDSELMTAATMLLHEHTLRYRDSVKGRKPNVKHNREKGHYQLYRDYFCPTKTIFSVEKFQRRYRISRKLFLTILNGARAHDDYFTAGPRCHR
jgi:hypothetical protein